jgi:hypothetical protein
MNYKIYPKKGWVVGWSEAKIEILYFYVYNIFMFLIQEDCIYFYFFLLFII